MTPHPAGFAICLQVDGGLDRILGQMHVKQVDSGKWEKVSKSKILALVI